MSDYDRLHALLPDREIRCFSEVSSTNDVAWKWAADKAPARSIVVADRQTASRGRQGRKWVTTPASSIAMSVIIRPDVETKRIGALSLVAGLSVRRALAEFVKQSILIKWPNDIVVKESDKLQKLAGILVESSISTRVRFVIIGIGINVACESVPPDLPNAISLQHLSSGEALDRAKIVQRVAQTVDDVLLCHQSDESWCASEFERFDALKGSRIRCESSRGSVEGIARGVSPGGQLCVQSLEDSTISELDSGDVHLYFF